MATYKRDFSKKLKRNIRKNIKTRKTQKTFKKRGGYKNKRRNGNKTKKVGGWPSFSLSGYSSDSGKSSTSSTSSMSSMSSTNRNIIETNKKEPFIVKDDPIMLYKKKNRQRMFMYIYDRGDIYGEFKVYLPEERNYKKIYKIYPKTITVSLADFDIIPVVFKSDNGVDIKKVEQLFRSDEEKENILKKNINANLMSERI